MGWLLQVCLVEDVEGEPLGKPLLNAEKKPFLNGLYPKKEKEGNCDLGG